MTELEFKSLAAQGFNRIPMIAEAFADLETPLTLYLKLAQATNGGKHSFLLESVKGGERFGRYSFIGLPASTVIRSHGMHTEVIKNAQVIEQHEGNPLDFIAEFQSRYKVAISPGMPRFCGGLAGYFGYDAVRYIERRLENTAPPDELHLPDIQLLLTEELAVIAKETAAVARRLGHEPRVAFLSYSTFGNPPGDRAEKVREAIRILDKKGVDFEYEGEMPPEVALDPKGHAAYAFNRLTKPANVLVMPAIHSASSRPARKILKNRAQGRKTVLR